MLIDDNPLVRWSVNLIIAIWGSMLWEKWAEFVLSQDDLKEEEEEKKANVKLEPGQIHDKRSKLDSLNYIGEEFLRWI